MSEAIVVWMGWGDTTWPSRDRARLVEVFGREEADSLLPVVQALEQEFSQSDAYKLAALGEMGRIAASEFRARHPEISEDAIQALAWGYTFDYR